MYSLKSKVLAALTLSTVVFCSLAPLRAIADDSSSAPASDVSSNRMKRKIGFDLGLADPSPGLIGFNIGYNVTDFMRVAAGYGSISMTSSIDIDANGNVTTSEAKATTIGFGVDGYVPGWNFTPTLGLHYGHVSYSGDGSLTVGGFDQSGGQVYASIGLAYQSPSGFDFSAGYNYSFKSGVGGTAFIDLGWYFDWLN